MSQTKIRTSTQVQVDANFDLNNKKIVSLTAATLAGEAVEFAQMNTAIANAISGVGNALHTPVADLTAAKAVLLAGRSDKMMMLVETMGLFRFDSESLAVSNDSSVLRPTDLASDADAGRWLKMSSILTDHSLLANIIGNGSYHLSLTERDKLTNIAEYANNYAHPNHSGDVTSAGDGALTIAANAVTNAKAAKMPTLTIKGNNAGASADPQDLTVSSVKTMLGLTALNLSQRYYRVTPTGTVNGTNTVFSIAANIYSGTEEVFLNGMLMNGGVGNDYTVVYGATSTITFLGTAIPQAGDIILINYSI